MSQIHELQRLHSLRLRGLLTEQEYERSKNLVLRSQADLIQHVREHGLPDVPNQPLPVQVSSGITSVVAPQPPSIFPPSSLGSKADHTTKKNNPFGLAGFILGLIGVVLWQVMSIFPLLAVVFGGIGAARFNPNEEKNPWMAWTGLGLGALFLLMRIAGNH